MTATRSTVVRVFDEQSSRAYLQGRESVGQGAANVFGDGDFLPLAQSADRVIAIEAEVVHSFSGVADDDPSDRSDVYLFRLWSWQLSAEGAVPGLFMPWQDFNGDEPPGVEYGWGRLLRVAVERIRSARYDREVIDPMTVGAPERATGSLSESMSEGNTWR